MDFEYLEKYDKYKQKILKYVLFKKRTEKEIRNKFQAEIENDNSDLNTDMLNNIIEELKENGYISDSDYIERAVNEFMALKNMSTKELIYKLYQKGLSKNVVEDYFKEHIEEIEEFEKQSCENIINKRRNDDPEKLKAYLMRKGYKIENINKYI